MCVYPTHCNLEFCAESCWNSGNGARFLEARIEIYPVGSAEASHQACNARDNPTIARERVIWGVLSSTSAHQNTPQIVCRSLNNESTLHKRELKYLLKI